MGQPKSVRKKVPPAERKVRRSHLRLVRPTKRRWKWYLGFRQRLYDGNHELHEWEDKIVLAAVMEMSGPASIKTLEERYPERFRRKPLWRTLNRLAKDGQLVAGGNSRWYIGGIRLHTVFTPTQREAPHGTHSRAAH